MNAEHLADYLINNDMEVLIVRRNLAAIADFLEVEGIQADMGTVKEAVEIANADPIVQMYYTRFA